MTTGVWYCAAIKILYWRNEVCMSNCQSYLPRLRSSASSQPPVRASMYIPHIIGCCRISKYMWPTSIYLVTQLGEKMTVMILTMLTGRSLLAMQSRSSLLSNQLSGCLYIRFASNTSNCCLHIFTNAPTSGTACPNTKFIVVHWPLLLTSISCPCVACI